MSLGGHIQTLAASKAENRGITKTLKYVWHKDPSCLGVDSANLWYAICRWKAFC